VDDGPKAENGVLYIGPWDAAAKAVLTTRWPFASMKELGPAFSRIDLSRAPQGSCPGWNDRVGLEELSKTGNTRVAIGFFCDAGGRAEGVRVFQAGEEQDRRRVDWRRADPPDPVAWPIATIAASLRIPLELITRVARPERPPLAVAVEALLNGQAPATDELRHQALQLLGAMDHPQVTALLVEQVRAEDWVARFHAVRSYARKDRGPGQEGRPTLDSLLADPDEGVRENLLRGIAELLPDVAFADVALHRQIDAAAARGLADQDEDVRAAAAEVQALRKKLLG
jgi:hypothetical protein